MCDHALFYDFYSLFNSNFMTKEELAFLLDGREYNNETSDKDEKLAFDNNLVICFGASDDLCEFRGKLYDEKGCYNGGDIYFCQGEIANPDEEDTDDAGIESFEKKSFPKIKAVWCPKNEHGQVECSWKYETEIPHATFDIFEDGELYCRGIVFDFSSIS